VIFLVGIVVSQGVLLLDFANQLRKQGPHGSRGDHSGRAVIRFKPILMTFLATFLDLLPMAVGVGRGSESLTPLARAVVWRAAVEHRTDADRRPRTFHAAGAAPTSATRHGHHSWKASRGHATKLIPSLRRTAVRGAMRFCFWPCSLWSD